MVVHFLKKLLRFPTFHKILLANFAIALASALLGVEAGLYLSRSGSENIRWELVVLLALTASLMGLGANMLVLRFALSPLLDLQGVARKVIDGDLTARVPESMLGDSSLDQLVQAFNSMLESVQMDRSRLETLSGQILQAQEDERKRIARELHDETAQALTALLVRLRLLSNATTLEEAKSRVAELREVTARTLEEVRKLALELRSAVLDDLGLVAALELYIDEYNQRGNATARLVHDSLPQRLPPEVELALYRVAQESLTNAARHSHSKNIEVRLERSDSSISLTVEDDGIGFDVDSVFSRRGDRRLGLFGMRERVLLLGGDFTVESAPGKFTRVTARVPTSRKSITV